MKRIVAIVFLSAFGFVPAAVSAEKATTDVTENFAVEYIPKAKNFLDKIKKIKTADETLYGELVQLGKGLGVVPDSVASIRCIGYRIDELQRTETSLLKEFKDLYFKYQAELIESEDLAKKDGELVALHGKSFEAVKDFVAVKATPKINGVQLWENGPYWASCNIGARNSWDYGYYFWWGDTVGCKRMAHRWVASDGSSPDFSFTEKIAPTYGLHARKLVSMGWTDSNGNLTSENDAANVQLGGDWRMPTAQDFQNFVENTSNECVLTNGIKGVLFRGKGMFSDASIFLPLAGSGGGRWHNGKNCGFYWSSSSSFENRCYSKFAMAMALTQSPKIFVEIKDRFYGHSIRPLRDSAE